MIRFGGAESIRGFIDESILANEYFLSRNNVNVELNENFSILGIIDYANYNNDVLSIKKDIYFWELDLKYSMKII